MSTFTPDDLRIALSSHLDTVVPPTSDLAGIRRQQRRNRARKLAFATVVTAAAAAVVIGAVLLVRPGASPSTDSTPDFVSPGTLDYSEGLRAYADPGRVLFLGGRSLPADDFAYLDTDAAATAYGMVFFDAGRPMLLREKGDTEALYDGAVEASQAFHPTAKADAHSADVAFAVMHDDQVTLVVRDLDADRMVASRPLDCADTCQDVVVDGIDHGVVFVRTGGGTYLWNVANDDWTRFAGAQTRVADVRNRVVLYDGSAPTLPLNAWRYVQGAVDAQLTFDGRHVLSWSPTLSPVSAADDPITLKAPGAIFFTFDTDGSVLAATAGDPTTFLDCEVPSGKCEKLGTVKVTGGDPMFLGNDM